jgi:DNA-directed RNA polymerase specialized sigma24 family protein
VTTQEFESWIEQHYTELLAVAKRRDRKEPEDVLHAALARVTENLDKFDSTKGALWTWCVNAIRSCAADTRDSRSSRARLGQEQKILRRASVSLGRKQPAPRAE